MANGKLFNRVGMTTTTTGTGTITLGSAITSPKKYQSFATAGVANNDVVEYLIEDGVEFELGLGTYTSSGTTLSRDTVRASSNSGSKITLSGSALVYIDAAAEDLPPMDQQTFNANGTWTKPQGNYRYALIECWGPGGSGGNRATTGSSGGGGGGSYVSRLVLFSSLAATETVTVGTGGAAVASSNANGNNGNGNTTFGSWVTAYPGGGGSNNAAGSAVNGGGGGGLAGAASGTTSGTLNGTSVNGRDVLFEGGGAYGGCINASNAELAAGKAFRGGGGGGPTCSTGPVNGTGGTSVLGGAGGNGDGTTPTAGTQPGGGGGAGRNGVSSGKGGDGRVVVTCW